MEEDNKLAALEGLLFVVGDDGLSINQMMEILEIEHDEAVNLINELREEYNNVNRGIRLHFLGNTFKLTTKEEHKKYYQKLLVNEENNTLSNSALETLAIVAYNEPITRVEVDEIRGVQTAQMIRKLVAKGLLKEVGKSELPGRPNLYATTSEFLDYFGLATIEDLPQVEATETNSENETELFTSIYKDVPDSTTETE